jgi:hypothetical protein
VARAFLEREGVVLEEAQGQLQREHAALEEARATLKLRDREISRLDRELNQLSVSHDVTPDFPKKTKSYLYVCQDLASYI